MKVKIRKDFINYKKSYYFIPCINNKMEFKRQKQALIEKERLAALG
jgi:hypothetical protein